MFIRETEVDIVNALLVVTAYSLTVGAFCQTLHCDIPVHCITMQYHCSVLSLHLSVMYVSVLPRVGVEITLGGIPGVSGETLHDASKPNNSY